jgi:hypothetical protein
VTKNPPPMRELSFLGESHPPHLHGFLVSHQGQFRLVALLGGRTLLEGTTWYQHSMGPEWYWRLFSDRIIHAIHLRALGHVKSLSEDGSTMQSVTGRIANPPNDCGTLKRFERLIWQ